jgi:hypothetical protein
VLPKSTNQHRENARTANGFPRLTRIDGGEELRLKR